MWACRRRGRRNHGGPKKWEAHTVRQQNEPRFVGYFVLFCFSPLLTTSRVNADDMARNNNNATRSTDDNAKEMREQSGRRCPSPLAREDSTFLLPPPPSLPNSSTTTEFAHKCPFPLMRDVGPPM